jgi:hypothetical protein
LTRTLALELAGARIDLRLPGAPPAIVAERYAAFSRAPGPARWVFELHPGPLPAAEQMTGRVTARDGTLRLEGLEPHGHLDAATCRGEALLDPYLVVVDALVRTAIALDLCARGGCLVHAAALVVDGVAHLAPGRSGAGKSTLAGLAGDVLSDELCAVIPDGEILRVHGTPWWKGRPGAVPLGAVWSLAWGAERTDPLSPAPALRHLCTNLVLPGHRPAERTAFELCGRVAATIPFGRLSFRPDTDVDALLRRRRIGA